MKNLIVAITFAMFSLTLPVVLAQQAVATEQVDQLVDVEDDSETKRIVIDIKTDEARDAEKEVREAIEKVGEIFGEKLGEELRAELEGLDAEERQELGKLFGGKNIHFGGDGMGFGEILVASLAIVFTLGMPIIILVLVLVFSNRKRKQKMQLISSYLEADQPVPAHVMAEFGSDSGTNSNFRSGLTLTLVGVALAIFLTAVDDWETATLGLIPMAIGVARLISWKYGDKHDSDSATV